MAEETAPPLSDKAFLAVVASLVLLALPCLPAHAIVGPSTEAQDLAPFVVMVLQRSGPVAGFCSGIVLGPRVVLTAAHCAPAGADLRIHYKEADAGAPALLTVAAVVRHPGYRADAVRARKRSIDLALIRLQEALPPRFHAAILGQSSATKLGASFRVAGFGVTREGEGATSGGLRVTALQARAPLSSLLLWAEGPARDGAGACMGDSGGPVLDAENQTVEALTLWSAGEGSRDCGTLTQALWLGPQRPWIAGVLAGWGMTPP